MSSFLRNILKLTSGSIIAQMISVLLIPIISRLYLPYDFGIFQEFTALLGVILVFSMGSYQLALVLPSDEKDAVSIFLLCIIIVSVVTIILTIIIFLFSYQISVLLFNEPNLSPYLFFLPLTLLLNSIFILLNYWNTRKKQFGVIAIRGIINTSVTKVTQIGVAFVDKPSPFGLILGSVASYVAAIAYLGGNLRKDFAQFRNKTKVEIKNIAYRYKNFPVFSVWSQLSNQVSIQIPTFLLSFFFSTTIVGYYSMANMAINMPMMLIGAAISQVFLQRANEEKLLNGHSKKVVSEVHHLLLALGVLPIIILMILGSDIFKLVFGSNWAPAGTYAAILGPWILLVFIAAPLSSLYNIYEKQNIGLAFHILLLTSRFVSLYVGALFGGPILCLTLFSITGVVFWTWNNFYLIRLAGLPVKEEMYTMIRYLFQGVLFALPVLVLRYLTDKIYILLPIAGLMILLYYVFLIKKDEEMKHQFSIFKSGE